MLLIIGLGNPGKQYDKTRHNVGFMAVDVISDRHNFSSFSEKAKLKSQIATGEIGGSKVVLCKPLTYMNLSGEAAQLVSHFYKILPENIIVIHDDIDLDFAVIRRKKGGGHAGHNGLRSIDQCLATKEYHRIRIGVGKPSIPNISVSDYVLSNFTDQEFNTLLLLLQKISDEVTNI